MNSTTIRRSIPGFTIYKHNDKNEEIAHGTVIINNKRHDNPIAFIEDIWVHKEYRRQGIATVLVNELLAIAKEYKCYKAVLDCEDHNIHLYETLGFIIWQNSMRKDL